MPGGNNGNNQQPQENNNNQNAQQEQNNQYYENLLGGIPVPEQHVEYEPDENEINYFHQEGPKSEAPKDELPEFYDINLDVPDFTDEQIAEQIKLNEDKKLSEFRRHERNVEAYDQLIYEHEQVLDILQKNKENLEEYKKNQRELLENREKEISDYLVENRKNKKKDKEENLPKDIDAYDALISTDKEKHRKMHDRLDEVIKAEKKIHDNDKFMYDYNKIAVNDIDELVNVANYARVLEVKIHEAGLEKLGPEEKAWFVKNTGTPKITQASITDYSHYYNHQKAAEDELQEKMSEYGILSGTTSDVKKQRQILNEEYEQYQSLVARHMVLKQTISKIAMGEDGIVSDFSVLEEMGSKTNITDYTNANLAIKEKLSVTAAIGNQELKDLGYDIDNAKEALDDYYKIDKKVKDYRPIIEKQIQIDKSLDDTKPENVEIINNAKQREQWMEDHSSQYIDDYFKNDGTPKESKYNDMKALSEKYSPDNDHIARVNQLESEVVKARFELYRAAQSNKMLQYNAINNAIKKENARIDRENKIIEATNKEQGRWKNQAACDERFKEDVEKRAKEATSKRRKMMMGYMVTNLATRLTAAVGDTAKKVGTVVAEGIVHGERVQVEKELNELKESQNTKQTAAAASLYIAQENRNNARRLDKDTSDKRNKDKALFQVVQSNDHTRKAQKASASHSILQEKIKAKEEELKEALEKEDAGIKRIEDKIGGQKFRDNQKKLEENRINKYQNNISTLATDIKNATEKIESVKVGEDLVLSEEIIKGFMNAKNDVEKQFLDSEEKKILKQDKELRDQLDRMNEYGKKLGEYLTPGNMEKVDTIVGLAETLYSAYSSVSKYLDGKEQEKKDEAEAKKINDMAGDLRKQQKESAKKGEIFKAVNEGGKAEALENAAKKYEKEDDPFELNIKDTIGDLKEKAQKINESMKGGGEKNETIIQNITDLTLEASQIIEIVSQKLNGIAAGMDVAYEEALSREKAEKGFLENINSIKNGTKDENNKNSSIVETALAEIREQKKTQDVLIDKELSDNALSIEMQKKGLENTKANFNAYLDSIGELGNREDEERKEALKKAEEKLAEDRKKAETDAKDTEDIRNARKNLKVVKDKELEAENARNHAERELKVKKGTNELAKTDLSEKKHLLEVFEEEQKRNEKQAREIQESKDYNHQLDKNKAYLALRQKDVDTAKSNIRKTAVISFFVGVANSAAQNAKGFMDQLTIGAAEAVVKGKVTQMENELADKEKTYDLKGQTALAKTRSKQEHLRKAAKIQKEKAKDDKYLNDMTYNAEIAASTQDDKAAKELQAERREILKDIKKRRKELVEARAEEKKQLDALHKQLKDQYNVNPEEAEISIDIKTGLNLLKEESAKQKVEQYIKENRDFIDILTSTAYTDSDSAQRQVIKEQVKNLKQDKEVEQKAEKLNKYSDKLKGLFTPDNMGRVDTIVGAAETIVGLYGSVKGFITGSGGGDEKEDKESKGVAKQIADMKEKAAEVRKGMMEAGDDKEKQQGVIENILDIAANMREITDNIAKKLDGYAKDYEDRLDDQREIRTHAENEVKAYQDIFKNKPELNLNEAFAEKRSADDKSIKTAINDSIELAEDALKASEKPVEDAEKELQKKQEELQSAETIVNAAQRKLDKLVAIEVEKQKGAALHEFRKAKSEIDNMPREDKSGPDYFQALNDLFEKTPDERIAEERAIFEKTRAEMQQKFFEKEQELLEKNKQLAEEHQQKLAEQKKEAQERENALKTKMDDLQTKLEKQSADQAKEKDQYEAQAAKLNEDNNQKAQTIEAQMKALQEKMDQLKAMQEQLKSKEEQIKAKEDQIKDQKVKLDDHQREKEAEEQRKQEEQNKAFEAEQKQRQENYKKMDKLRDILDNLNDTNNGYFGHTNSKQFEQVQNKLYDFISNKDDNISFEPDQTEKLKTALTDYLKHVGMGVASHKNGNIRKENVLAALNIIDPKEALVYKGMADAKRDGKGTSKQIDLDKLMEKEYIKRENKPRRELNAGNVSKPAKDIEGPKPAPLAPKKNK